MSTWIETNRRTVSAKVYTQSVGYTPYAAPDVGAFLCHKTYNATTRYHATVSAFLPKSKPSGKCPDGVKPPGSKAAK